LCKVAEIIELQKLWEQAKQPAVRQILEQAITQFQTQHSTTSGPAEAVVGMALPTPAATTLLTSSSSETKYEHVKWGWDSGEKFVSVYVTVRMLAEDFSSYHLTKAVSLPTGSRTAQIQQGQSFLRLFY
jgi:hypothetical protein